MGVVGILFLGLCLNAMAVTSMTTKVHDIDHGTASDKDTLVFLTNGRVAKIATFDKVLIDQISSVKEAGQSVELFLDDKRYISDLRVIAEESLGELSKSVRPTRKSFTNFTFVPTTVTDMEKAKQYFSEARLYEKDSQCFNRAMVWSYEWWKKHSLKSNKILIFFTRNYIRRFDPHFEWWFHIAPAVNVMHEGKVVERVMDVKYSSGPRSHAEWTRIFMKGDVRDFQCPYITKFSEYADFPYTGECYLMRTHMYTWQPADLQMQEDWGFVTTEFKVDDVKAAYLEAFDEQL